MKFGLRNRNPTSSWPRVVRRAGAAAVLVEAAGKSERWQCQSCMQSLATTLLLPSHRRDILTWNGIDTLRVQCPDLCAFFSCRAGRFLTARSIVTIHETCYDKLKKIFATYFIDFHCVSFASKELFLLLIDP